MPKKSTKLLIPLLAVCSAIFGCSQIPRPDTTLCVVNAPAQQMKCYNLKTDYNDDGSLKPDAKPKYWPVVSIEDVNKHICTDPDSFGNLKAYIKLLREEYDKCRSGK